MPPGTPIPTATIDRAYELLKRATKAVPVKSRELERHLGINDADGHPQSRAIIKAVIREKNLPLGATGDGYFVIRTLAELKEYGRTLDARVRGNVNRKALVYAAYAASNPGSLGGMEDMHKDDDEDEA